MSQTNDKGACVTQTPEQQKANKKLNTMASARRKETIFYICMVALPMIQFALYYVYVNLNSFLMSFQAYIPGKGFEWVGLKNFKNMWIELTLPNTNLSNGLKNAIYVYLLGWLVKPFQLLFPFYVYKKMPAHGFFKTMLFLPQILSTTCTALMFKYIVDQVLPELAELYFGKTMLGLLSDPSSTFWVAWFFGVLDGIGGSILIYTSAMMRIPETLVEYAKLEGCSPLQEFAKITFPLILPTFAVYLVLGFTSIFTANLHLYTFFAEGSPIQTIGYYTYVLTLKSEGYLDYPKASAIGMFFTLILVPLTIVLRKVLNKITPDVQY